MVISDAPSTARQVRWLSRQHPPHPLKLRLRVLQRQEGIVGFLEDLAVRLQGCNNHCRNRQCKGLRAEPRALPILEVARAADAQATTMRSAPNQRARLQLLEANTRATILPEEGQERCRVAWEAGRAKRQREDVHLGNQM